MKKVYAALVALLFAGVSFGQSSMSLPQVQKSQQQKVEASIQAKYNTPPVQNPTGPQAAKSSPTVYFSDDFSNPANWTMGHSTGTQGDWTIGSSALGFIGVLNSTSGPDFAGFDSDALGQGTTNNAWIQMANPVNLTGVPLVQLNWQQAYMKFQDVVWVEVSNDGSTWDSYEVNSDIQTNQQTSNPDFRSLDISASAGNEATVWVRFRYEGAWDYAWAIDDIEIVDPPANDLDITNVYFNSFADTLSTWHYSEIPEQHSLLDTMVFAASVDNVGSAAQDNVTLDVSITGMGTYSDQSPAGTTIQPAANDSVETPTIFIASQQGQYDITFNVTSDSTDAQPLNNTITRTWNVSDTVYARDFDDFAGGFTYGPGTSTHQMCVLYEIRQPDTITSIDIVVFNNGSAGTTDGAVVNFHIYDNSFTPIASNNFVSIDATWFNTWHKVTFDPPVVVQPGVFLAGYETLNASDEVWVGQGSIPNISPAVTSFVNIDNGGFGWIDATPQIRMNVKPWVNPCSAAISGSVTDVSCNGDTDGAIDIAVAGGTAPFSYTWSNGATTEDVTGLAPGNYGVLIEWDAVNNCSDSVAFTVGEPTVLAVDTIATLDEECGQADGSATATVSGGTSPYNYDWSNGSTSATASSVGAGAYTVTITDDNGCTSTSTATVSGTVAVTAASSTNLADCDSINGDATVSVLTGQGGYAYMWDNGDMTATADSLGAGSYSVTITDSIGCSATYVVNVSNVNAPVVALGGSSDVSCNGGADGELDVDASGGTGSFSYAWTSGDTTDVAMGLMAGDYTVTVTDSLNCISIESYSVTEPDALTLSGTTTGVSCNGAGDGAVDITAGGGTPSITFDWGAQGTNEDLTALAGGNYTVTITDANSCTETMMFTVAEPAVLGVNTNGSDIDCFGGADGSVTSAANGGTTPYTYSWSNGSSSQNISSLGTGTYTVTVTDANGCSTTGDATLTEPATAVSVTLVSVENEEAVIGPGSNGSIDIDVAGGTPPYNFTWSNGAPNVEDPNGLAGGDYTVAVTDANGCTANLQVTVGTNVGIGEISKQMFTVFPNPNNGVFNVAFGSNANGKFVLTVTDMVGKVVYLEDITLAGATNRELNMSNLSKGVYLLSVVGNDTKSVERIVIR